MSRKERVFAALLLTVAVAGGASIPRLLASPPTPPLRIALGAGPGRSVVQAPAIPKPPQRAAPPRTISPPPQAASARVEPAATATAKPTPVGGSHNFHAGAVAGDRTLESGSGTVAAAGAASAAYRHRVALAGGDAA